MAYAITDHEYTLDGGTTVQPCTAGMDNGNGTATIPVGNVAKAAGTVGVRVKAATGRNASDWLFNSVPFTTAAVYIFEENWETGPTDPPWTVTNLDPTQVSISTANGKLVMTATKGTTTAGGRNMVRHTNGFSSYPMTVEAQLTVSNTDDAYFYWGFVADSNNYIFANMGTGTAKQNEIRISHRTAGTLLPDVQVAGSSWVAVTHVKFECDNDSTFRFYISTDNKASWQQLGGTFSGQLTGTLKPTYSLNGYSQSSGTSKTISSDYLRIYQHTV